jgi:ABC-2 type transport system permease protein
VSAQPALGRPIRGPSALDGDLRRFAHLTRTLAVSDFRLRFFGSALGYFWQLMRPLLLFTVLYLVFTQAIKLGAETKFFPVVLLTAIVLYTFFQEATNGAVTSVVDREQLVRKIQFPRLVIPTTSVVTATFNLVLNLLVVFVFALASGVTPHVGWLQVPVLLVLLWIGSLGMATLLSALYVRARDVKPIWDVLLQILLYGSPVIYAIETIPSLKAREILMLNPLGAIIQQMRHALIDPTAPTAWEVAGGAHRLVVPLGIIFGAFVLGLWYFNREAPRIAEEL